MGLVGDRVVANRCCWTLWWTAFRESPRRHVRREEQIRRSRQWRATTRFGLASVQQARETETSARILRRCRGWIWATCGPCAPRAQKSWVSLAVQCQAAQLPTTSRRCMPVPLDGPGRKRSGSKDVVLERDEYEDDLDFVTMRRLKAASGRGSTQRRWLTGKRSRRRR